MRIILLEELPEVSPCEGAKSSCIKYGWFQKVESSTVCMGFGWCQSPCCPSTAKFPFCFWPVPWEQLPSSNSTMQKLLRCSSTPEFASSSCSMDCSPWGHWVQLALLQLAAATSTVHQVHLAVEWVPGVQQPASTATVIPIWPRLILLASTMLEDSYVLGPRKINTKHKQDNAGWQLAN